MPLEPASSCESNAARILTPKIMFRLKPRLGTSPSRVRTLLFERASNPTFERGSKECKFEHPPFERRPRAALAQRHKPAVTRTKYEEKWKMKVVGVYERVSWDYGKLRLHFGQKCPPRQTVEGCVCHLANSK